MKIDLKTYNKHILLSLGLLFLSLSIVIAQASNSKILKAMDKVRQGSYFNGTQEPFDKYLQNKPLELINEMRLYISDSNVSVRLQAIDMIYLASFRNQDSIIRQTALNYLILACNDRDPAIVKRASEDLQDYPRDDYSASARDSIASYIKRRVFYLDNILLLAGYLNLKNVIPDIKLLSADKEMNNTIRWAAFLALSRMGDQNATQICIKLLQSNPMDNTIANFYLPGLIYTRQKDAFDYILTILFSDEKNCTTSNPDDHTPIVCGYKAMELLTPVIDQIPLNKVQEIGMYITEKENEDLETARAWFKEKGDRYVIKDESF